MSLRALVVSFSFFLVFHFIGFADNTPVDTVTESRNVSSFTVLKIQGNFNVVISPGSTCSLKVSGDKALMQSIESKNTGTTLNITMKPDASGTATLYVTMKEILQISINTTGTIGCTKDIKSDDLSLSLNNKAEGTLSLNVKMLTLNTNDDKSFVLKGKAEKCNATIEGEGNMDMSTLKVDDLTVENSSDGDVKIYAHPTLHAKMAGTGKLTYYGNPRVKVFKVQGDGQVIEGK